MSEVTDFVPGNPEEVIIGKVEKPARRHRPQPPKPVTEATIKFRIQQRMDELEPVVDEYNRLEVAVKALREIK